MMNGDALQKAFKSGLWDGQLLRVGENIYKTEPKLNMKQPANGV